MKFQHFNKIKKLNRAMYNFHQLTNSFWKPITDEIDIYLLIHRLDFDFFIFGNQRIYVAHLECYVKTKL